MEETAGIGKKQECPICDGVGLVQVVKQVMVGEKLENRRVTKPCECQQSQQDELRVIGANIPKRYRGCVMGTFEPHYAGADASLKNALTIAQRFVDGYPHETTEGKGLLLTGIPGCGKTHLAVAILLELIRDKGAQGLFCDFSEWLKSIQNSYNPQVGATEYDLAKPLLTAEVLLIDDLGAQRPSGWVLEQVAYVLNRRYNEKLTTIITSNYPNQPSLGGERSDVERAARQETLGDRIGDRMRSRLVEMCFPVIMTGKDFRGIKGNSLFS